MKRFLRNSLLFAAGLLALGLVIDARVGRTIRRNNGSYNKHRLVGWDVYEAVRAADAPGPEIRKLYLGDSVARQMFPPDAQPPPGVRYLCSNQAISLAGQYYLLRDALQSCPNVREVDFLYFPGSWANELPRILSHDYYCAYFHSPEEVIETFGVTGDFDLLAAHIGRCLFPNLLAANSASRPFTLLPPARAGGDGVLFPPVDTEPLLTALTRIGHGFTTAQTSVAPGDIYLSKISLHFLPKIRDLCRAHGIHLRILPSPCSDAVFYPHADRLYDRPILYFDHSEFKPDAIHFQDRYLDDARRRVIGAYESGDGLP